MEIEHNVAYDEGYYLYKVRIYGVSKYFIRIAAESLEKVLEIAKEYADGSQIISIIDKNKNIIIQKGYGKIK
jgi:hypothetical protein